MKQKEIEQVLKYQIQTMDYLNKWLTEEILKDKLLERKCKYCGENAEKDAFDDDGDAIEICEKCDSKKENL